MIHDDLPVLSGAHQLHDVQLAREEVRVPEWATTDAPHGYRVYIWELTGQEVADWRQSMLKRQRDGSWRVDPKLMRDQSIQLLVRAVRDKNGDRIFADADAPLLRRLGSGGMERLVDVARRLSRIVETEEEVEDEGNDSEATPSGSSISGSPLTSTAPAVNS